MPSFAERLLSSTPLLEKVLPRFFFALWFSLLLWILYRNGIGEGMLAAFPPPEPPALILTPVPSPSFNFSFIFFP